MARKKKKSKSKKRKKLTKWEKQFIEDFGWELYERFLDSLHSLQYNPELFELLVKIDPPTTNSLMAAYENFCRTHPLDEKDEEVQQ